ncbi:uncharacterized protein BBOV_IV008940 [Babesia bovis T2Bo]|uniref:Uncharacterized protein n=1 Tax=Babesia bovis TaxID=5865 RepID=A7ARS9_BABBO|nr:uncharacterized protein BBOV_IV008940 [Babesia bovis T2Bo]EDO07248.1 hypothetical protein BBOV_IV008940 [Babesia bovis T2Bo]|eukprot:XP_001610816.1 hypothetical protein [Babesia bovis T2Bo]
MELFTAIIVFLLGEQSLSIRALRLRSGVMRSKNVSFLELKSTKWNITKNDAENEPKTGEEIILAIQDLKDNVDFHMNDFSKTVKETILDASENIDATELQHLRDASEKVDDSIRTIQASIKKECDNISDKFKDKRQRHISADVTKKINTLKDHIKEFVRDGIHVLKDNLKSLTKEFTTATDNTDKENGSVESAEVDKKETPNYHSEESPKSNESKEVKDTESLVQVNSYHTNAESSERLIPNNTENHSADGQGIKYSEADTTRPTQSSNQSNPNNDTGENRVSRDKFGDDEHATSKPATNENDKQLDNQTMNNGTSLEKKENKDEVKRNSTQSVNENTQHNESSKQDSNTTTNSLTYVNKDIDLSSVPPTAITRTIETYKQKLEKESSALIKEIQF